MNKTDPDPICLRSEYSTKKRRRQEKFLPTSLQLIKKSCEDFLDKLHPPSILIISKCCFAPKVIDIKTFGRRFIVFEVSLFSLRRRCATPQAPPAALLSVPAAHIFDRLNDFSHIPRLQSISRRLSRSASPSRGGYTRCRSWQSSRCGRRRARTPCPRPYRA